MQYGKYENWQYEHGAALFSENKTAIRLYEKLGFNTYKYGMMKRL